MTLIRVVEIENFRSVKALVWRPHHGINCLIGPGDSGKSTVLDAIDFCMGARRSLPLTDSDFCAVDIEKPIRICVTLGALPDELKNIDSYGLYLRDFNSVTGEIVPEPEATLETVITIQLLVESDLEPQWSLVSARAAAQGQSRSLSWAERVHNLQRGCDEGSGQVRRSGNWPCLPGALLSAAGHRGASWHRSSGDIFFSKKYRWLSGWLEGRFKLRGMMNIPMEAFEEFCRAKTNFYIFEKVPAPKPGTVE